MARRGRQLATGILINQLVILTATVLIGFGLFAYAYRHVLDNQYENRAAAIAQVAAVDPVVIECVSAPEKCASAVQSLAEQIRSDTGASYVVVFDIDGIRHSHPFSNLIGQKNDEPLQVLDGKVHTGIDVGSTGRSANGRAPIFDSQRRVIGEVSAGLRESTVTSALLSQLPTFAVWFGLALIVGTLASWLLATRLKKRTFGLELDELSQLVREREATLHAIREGVIAFDQQGRVTMVNDEARRLLGLGHAQLGGRLDDLVGPGRLHDVLSGAASGRDEEVVTDDFYLVVNRMPVFVAGRPHGSVVTLRDRTETSGLMRELDAIRNLTDALRAQQHEFSNRMHTVAGLLELNQPDEALEYLTESRGSAESFAERLRARIESPVIVGLLVGKAAVAKERGVDLRVTEDSWLAYRTGSGTLTTIIGNLVDNALDALQAVGGNGQFVEVQLLEDEDTATIVVTDNGPGIKPGDEDAIFVDGYTTKTATGPMRRGLGLALVRRLVLRLGGTISVRPGEGAQFVVRLPKGGPE